MKTTQRKTDDSKQVDHPWARAVAGVVNRSDEMGEVKAMGDYVPECNECYEKGLTMALTMATKKVMQKD